MKVDDHRARRLVADAVARCIDGVPRVLVAGVVHGDGASTVIAALREVLGARVVAHAQAHVEGPAVFEGAPLGEGAGFAALDEGFVRQLGGLVLVVRAEHTPREALAQVAHWAHARSLPLLGVVWNEGGAPLPWRERGLVLARRLHLLRRRDVVT